MLVQGYLTNKTFSFLSLSLCLSLSRSRCSGGKRLIAAESSRARTRSFVVSVSSHESATFRGWGGHFCGTRLATSQGLLHLSIDGSSARGVGVRAANSGPPPRASGHVRGVLRCRRGQYIDIYVFMYIHVCLYICICIYICIYMYIYIYIYIYMCVCACVYIYIYMYLTFNLSCSWRRCSGGRRLIASESSRARTRSSALPTRPRCVCLP